jgi:hypothetical protein
MLIKASIIINAPLKRVWQTFTDLTCWENWNTVIRDVRSEEKTLGNSSILKCSFRPFLFPINVDIKIKEILPDERIVWSASKTGLTAYHEFLFREHEKGVMVTSKETFTGLLTKASGFLLPKKRMLDLTKIFLKDLKKASEH